MTKWKRKRKDEHHLHDNPPPENVWIPNAIEWLRARVDERVA